MLIPFGKYRGQQIEVLLSDPDYLTWCEEQQDLVKKYASFFEQARQLMGTAQDCSPEHNKLQARFLTDEAFCRHVIECVMGQGIYKFKMNLITFEKEILEEQGTKKKKYFVDVIIPFSEEESPQRKLLLIELKPSIGDDFPKILRKLQGIGEWLYEEVYSVVLCEKYNGSIPLDQVKEMFKRSRISFLVADHVEL